MTLNDFKHWFEGFCSAIIDQPTKEQWQLVLKKFLELKKAQWPFDKHEAHCMESDSK